jgi:hypothetical protein
MLFRRLPVFPWTKSFVIRPLVETVLIERHLYKIHSIGDTSARDTLSWHPFKRSLMHKSGEFRGSRPFFRIGILLKCWMSRDHDVKGNSPESQKASVDTASFFFLPIHEEARSINSVNQDRKLTTAYLVMSRMKTLTTLCQDNILKVWWHAATLFIYVFYINRSPQFTVQCLYVADFS